MEFKFPKLSYRAQKAWLQISPEDRESIAKLGKHAGDALVPLCSWSIGLPYKKPSDPFAERMARGLIWKHYSKIPTFFKSQSKSWKGNWAKDEGESGRAYPGDEAYAKLHYPQYLTDGKLQGIEDSDALEGNLQGSHQGNPQGNQQGNPSESETESMSKTKPNPIVESGSGETFDPKKIDEGEVRYGSKGIVQILCETLGKGFWKSAVAQLGEEAVKDDFLTFCAEYNAKETVRNAAAAFTSRLGKLGAKTKDGREVRHA